MSTLDASLRVPTAEEIAALHTAQTNEVVHTPVWDWLDPERERLFGPHSRTSFEFELLQRTGSFKYRGALAVMRAELERARANGVVAVSAGNHAIAVACAARSLDVDAKVVMLAHSNPRRVAACRDYGARVELIANVHAAFAEARRMEREEGRVFVHPFNGVHTVMGTATLGLEIIRALPRLDLMVVPIGGGGLAAGVALAIKQLRPECRVVGVEPVGADSMSRSFAAGQAVALDRLDTIADSLAAPHAEAYTYAICRDHIDRIVRIEDGLILGSEEKVA